MFGHRFTALRIALVPWLILLLLAGLGLRVCIPAVATSAGETHAVHLESVITSAADQHETNSDGDLDLPLSAVLKALQTNLAFGALFVFVVGLVFVRTASVAWPEVLAFRPPRGYSLTPPSRAPPR